MLYDILSTPPKAYILILETPPPISNIDNVGSISRSQRAQDASPLQGSTRISKVNWAINIPFELHSSPSYSAVTPTAGLFLDAKSMSTAILWCELLYKPSEKPDNAFCVVHSTESHFNISVNVVYLIHIDSTERGIIPFWRTTPSSPLFKNSKE